MLPVVTIKIHKKKSRFNISICVHAFLNILRIILIRNTHEFSFLRCLYCYSTFPK